MGYFCYFKQIWTGTQENKKKINLLAYWLSLFYFLKVISVHERRSAGLNQACCKQMLCKLPQRALLMTAILSYDIHCNCCSLGPFLGHSSFGFPKMGIFGDKYKNLKINISFQTNRIWKPYLSFMAYQYYRTEMLKYIICHYIYDMILLLNISPGVW